MTEGKHRIQTGYVFVGSAICVLEELKGRTGAKSNEDVLASAIALYGAVLKATDAAPDEESPELILRRANGEETQIAEISFSW